MKKTTLLLLGSVAATIVSVSTANAALRFSDSVGNIAVDCGDSDAMAEQSGVCVHNYGTVYTVDILFDNEDATGGLAGTSWGFTITKNDTIEIASGGWGLSFGMNIGTYGSSASGPVLTGFYTPDVDLASGVRVATLSYTTAMPYALVDDGLADIVLAGAGGFGVTAVTVTGVSEFEVQPVPLPASSLLLLGGVAALAGASRRRKA